MTDPTAIEPELGGRPAFEALAAAARDAGMGIIIDIVPNHTAFSPANPWLADVLRHGRSSMHAPAFDIDWDAGPLVLPFLPDPFEIVLERGDFAVEGDEWVMGGCACRWPPDRARNPCASCTASSTGGWSITNANATASPIAASSTSPA